MVSRRFFLKSSGLAMVAFGAAPRALVRTAYAATPGRKRTLVVVFQRGACDGLNTVVPYADAAYAALRPNIAVPAPRGGALDAALDLDGRFGLHPALAPLLPYWKDGTLAAVHAVGSPDATRSHFDAQDFMETGTPGRKSTPDGWLNRHLAATPDGTPFRGVALTPTLPRVLQGAAPAVAMADIRSFDIRGGSAGGAARGFEGMYDAAVRDALSGTGAEALDAVQYLKAADPARYRPAAGADYPRGKLGDSLRQVAQLVKADVGLEVAFTETGGWDTHAGEGGVTGQLAQRLRELGQALAAFRVDLADRLQDVVLVTLTEFGRTARENGNRGTDHGHASVAFVMGGSVRGGAVHGRFPGLGPDELYEGRDLALTTDFRDLLSEVLARHLAAKDLARVFPGHAADPRRFPGVMRA